MQQPAIHGDLALAIGKTLRNARLDSGHKSRRAFVHGSAVLKNRITPEGVRKIEHGERVPKLENVRMLAKALDLPEKKTKELETWALQASVGRVARRSGNADISFRIQGSPMQIQRLPPKKKAEDFTRAVVSDLMPILTKIGVEIPEDFDYFRRVARSTILKRLET